jgi:hypothetical protein
MELVFKRTVILLMLLGTFLIAGAAMTGVGALNLGGVAYAGEDDDDDDDGDDVTGGSVTSGGGDTGSSPSGGVNTGGGGLADSDPSALPIALGGLGALAGGTLLLRRRAQDDG